MPEPARLVAVTALFVSMALPARAQQEPALSDQAARAAEAATLFENGRVAFEQNDLQKALEYEIARQMRQRRMWRPRQAQRRSRSPPGRGRC